MTQWAPAPQQREQMVRVLAGVLLYGLLTRIRSRLP